MSSQSALIKIALVAFCCIIYINLSSSQRQQQTNFEYNQEDIDLSRLEWWKKTNFYHVYVRSFKDSDGDGNGDLRGLLSKLDYLKFIGVETLLLSPFYSSPMKDGGYDVSNYTDINPLFGTMKDFDDLILGLKVRKMRIVLDFIPNHTSNEHYWFKCSERAFLDPKKCYKYKDYYVWSNSTKFQNKYPSNWLSQFGGQSAWQWSEVRKEFYYHQFLAEQPDLNMRSPDVQQELKQVVRFWLNKGADGLRVDAVIYLYENQHLFDEPEKENFTLNQKKSNNYDSLEHIYTVFLHDSAEQIKVWRDIAQSYRGENKVIITEGYGPLDKILEYYGPNPNHKFADMPFNFNFSQLTLDNHKSNYLKDIITTSLNGIKSLNWPSEHNATSPWTCWVTGNHDNSRLANRLGLNNVDFYKWLAHLILGSPVDYYGDEIGLLNANFSDIPEETKEEAGEWSRLPYRVPMAWTSEGGFTNGSKAWMPLNQNYKQNNVKDLLDAASNDHQNHIKRFMDLLKLKRDYLKTLIFGDLAIFSNHLEESKSRIFALARTYPEKKGQSLMLLSNLDQTNKSVVRLVEAKGVLKGLTIKPPKEVRILLINYETVRLNKDNVVQLEGLILKPAQSMIVRF